ncbi:hypothetical protein [Nocardia sp. NPDC049149]|uniref:hypothetical protein n=1 Tax=Nocardia sp. NPDC049149 TaxID=3364315 RepID=UPI0037216DFA
MTVSKRTAVAATAFGALCAAAATAAPNAGASVSNIDIAVGLSFGSSSFYGASCSYQVTATAKPGSTVVFLDEIEGARTDLTFKPASVVADTSGKAVTTWTPARKGGHKIWAAEYVQGETYFITPITVNSALGIGPICAVMPF